MTLGVAEFVKKYFVTSQGVQKFFYPGLFETKPLKSPPKLLAKFGKVGIIDLSAA